MESISTDLTDSESLKSAGGVLIRETRYHFCCFVTVMFVYMAVSNERSEKDDVLLIILTEKCVGNSVVDKSFHRLL